MNNGRSLWVSNLLLVLIIIAFIGLFIDSVFSDIGFLNYSWDIIFVQNALFVYLLAIVLLMYSIMEYYLFRIKWYVSFIKSVLAIGAIYGLNGYLCSYNNWEMISIYRNPRGNTDILFFVSCLLVYTGLRLAVYLIFNKRTLV